MKKHRVLAIILAIMAALSVVGVGAAILWATTNFTSTGSVTVVPKGQYVLDNTVLSWGSSTVAANSGALTIPVSVTLTNDGTEDITGLTITNTTSPALPTGWVVSVTQPSYPILAYGGTATITFSVTATKDAVKAAKGSIIDLSHITFALTPIG